MSRYLISSNVCFAIIASFFYLNTLTLKRELKSINTDYLICRSTMTIQNIEIENMRIDTLKAEERYKTQMVAIKTSSNEKRRGADDNTIETVVIDILDDFYN